MPWSHDQPPTGSARAFPKLLNTAEGGLMAWLRGWMGDSSWGRNPGSGAGMTKVIPFRFDYAVN